MKYLTKVVEHYRIGTENEATNFLAEMKTDPSYEIVKSSITKKNKKEKGEIIDEWVHLEVVKLFNDEKMPDSEIDVIYEVH